MFALLSYPSVANMSWNYQKKRQRKEGKEKKQLCLAQLNIRTKHNPSRQIIQYSTLLLVQAVLHFYYSHVVIDPRNFCIAEFDLIPVHWYNCTLVICYKAWLAPVVIASYIQSLMHSIIPCVLRDLYPVKVLEEKFQDFFRKVKVNCKTPKQ